MTWNDNEEHTTEELEGRVAELQRLMADADETLQSMRPSSPTASGENEMMIALEHHVDEVEGEMQRIKDKLPPAPRSHRPRPRLPAHMRRRKKNPVEQFPLHTSPNTVQTVIDLQRRCDDRLGGEAVEMVWALVFKMPEQKKGTEAEEEGDAPDASDAPEDEDEDDLNALEAELGYDLDGDGDVGVRDDEARKSQQRSGTLRISHEAWVACERIIESDLVLRHVIPIDQRFLVRGVSAVPCPAP